MQKNKLTEEHGNKIYENLCNMLFSIRRIRVRDIHVKNLNRIISYFFSVKKNFPTWQQRQIRSSSFMASQKVVIKIPLLLISFLLRLQ
jgi:hypothetical protein